MGRLCCGHGVYVSNGGLYYWIIMGRLYCGHGVYVSTGGSTTRLLWEDCVVVMLSMILLGALLLDYYGKTIVVIVSMCLLWALLLDYYGKTMLWSWCLCVYWRLYFWIIMGRLCCGHGVYVSTRGYATGILWQDYVVVMVSHHDHNTVFP
jgi:hypothetical protein